MMEIRTNKEVEFIKEITKISIKDLCDAAKVKDKNILNKSYYDVGKVHSLFNELNKRIETAVKNYNKPDNYEQAIIDFKALENKFKEDMSLKQEVDNTDNTSGIYVIYIDGFDTEQMQDGDYILPVYVGQSKNIHTRISSHKRSLKEIFGCSVKEFNSRLKSKKEKQYLYCKLRKCISDCKLDLDNVKFKVLEYCSETELDEKERFYIDLYKCEDLGLNQMPSVQNIVKCNPTKASDKDIINVLNSIIADINRYLENKCNLGFFYFNSHMLGYNAYSFLYKLESKTKTDELLNIYNEAVKQWKKLNEYVCIFEGIGDTFFIEASLEIKNRKK